MFFSTRRHYRRPPPQAWYHATAHHATTADHNRGPATTNCRLQHHPLPAPARQQTSNDQPAHHTQSPTFLNFLLRNLPEKCPSGVFFQHHRPLTADHYHTPPTTEPPTTTGGGGGDGGDGRDGWGSWRGGRSAPTTKTIRLSLPKAKPWDTQQKTIRTLQEALTSQRESAPSVNN